MEQAEETLKALAADDALRGQQWDLQENPQQAEILYRKALTIYEELLERTGNRAYGTAAKETCTTLADLCMQQGNMHGADLYYVKALSYGTEPFGTNKDSDEKNCLGG